MQTYEQAASKLIDKNSPLYLKRLVREIRSTFCRCGVYYHEDGMDHNSRLKLVEFTTDGNRIRMKSHDWKGYRNAQNVDGFYDSYGQHITASRSPR